MLAPDEPPCGCRRDDLDPARLPAEGPRKLACLYLCHGLSTYAIARLTGMDRQRVTRALRRAGVPLRPRGTGGRRDTPRPGDALYADPVIGAILDAHDIRRVPRGGPLWARFPDPVPLTTALVRDLYWSGGVALNHIELLTGQPAMTVRRFMRRTGIALRGPGGRTPFLRRWRTSISDDDNR